jgi:hypothetical protein
VRSAVLPDGGDWNLRAELRQCRKQRAQVSSVMVAILCSIGSRFASAALPPVLCFLFVQVVPWKGHGACRYKLPRYSVCICCLLYEERTCLLLLTL